MHVGLKVIVTLAIIVTAAGMALFLGGNPLEWIMNGGLAFVFISPIWWPEKRGQLKKSLAE